MTYSFDQILKMMEQLPKPKKPLVSAIHVHSLDAPGFFDALTKQCGPFHDGPSLSPYAGPVCSEIVIRQDDKTLPGFAEFYDGKGNMINAIKVSQ